MSISDGVCACALGKACNSTPVWRRINFISPLILSAKENSSGLKLRLRGEDFFFLSSLSLAFYFLYPIEYGRVRVYYIKSTDLPINHIVTNLPPPSFSQSATCTKRLYRACRLETRPCLGSMARHDLG